MPKLFLAYETASGYALFERLEGDEIGTQLAQVQASVLDMSKFSRIVKLQSFVPFKTAEEALQNINAISEGSAPDTLVHFLEMNLPKVKEGKKPKFALGVADHKLGAALSDRLGVPIELSDISTELLRGIRMHFEAFLKELRPGDLEKAQLGLGHSYSRSKVKFNVNRQDNMIIQAIALVDQLDKDINTFAMRVREWYGWHFPEMAKVVTDNILYAQTAKALGDKGDLSDEKREAVHAVLGDDGIVDDVFTAAKASMGMELSDIDLMNIRSFADRVTNLAKYRTKLHAYLVDKMDAVAPNLATLIGELVGARLISHAGSLTNLAKYPASTVQILGAEKALFRALKTKGNTPKYGLIFHSSFIGRAAPKNKGRISRYLANKCCIASRIDSFSEAPTHVYGEKLKEQVEERLAFYDSGKAPRKNIEVMHEATMQAEAMAPVAMDDDEDDAQVPKSAKKAKKRKASEVVDAPGSEKKSKKKKRKTEDVQDDSDAEKTPKKSKKKKRKSEA